MRYALRDPYNDHNENCGNGGIKVIYRSEYLTQTAQAACQTLPALHRIIIPLLQLTAVAPWSIK